jgi:hypothetical protein
MLLVLLKKTPFCLQESAMFGQPFSYTKPDQRFARRDVTGTIPLRAGIVSIAILVAYC